ncbi:MAG TPA: hypothetical protein VHX44_10220, partial [Planctomycetota bacterium]|nr:hypothetical protein [Planctomycetota bacterium]
GKREVETSNEKDILKALALQWFDHHASFIGYQQGVMGANGDYSLHDMPGGNNMAVLTGSGTTIGKNVVAAHDDGFPRHLPEGLPAALAAYAFVLNSRPLFPMRQWTPVANQALYRDYQIEFRHPMLIMYHDRASAIYVHYGRNADPDEVFGHWDDCATPPASLNISADEFRRRQRFEAWQTSARLERLYDLLHPTSYDTYRRSVVDMPPAPVNPGAEPVAPMAPGAAPAQFPDPGAPPRAVPAPVWTQSRAAWGGVTGGTTSGAIARLPDWAQTYGLSVDLQAAHDQWLAQFPPGGRITAITPKTSTADQEKVVLTPLAGSTVTTLTTPSNQQVTLAAPVATGTMATGLHTYAATVVPTGEQVVVTARKTSVMNPHGYGTTVTIDWSVDIGVVQNWGQDPSGLWAYVLGDKRHFLATSATGAFPETAASFHPGKAWWNVFPDQTGCSLVFHLDAAAEVAMTSFSFDDTQVTVDGVLRARYNGDISWTGPIDRTWSETLAAGDHTVGAYADNNGSNLGVRGLFLRVANPLVLATALADADLIAYRGYLADVDAWNLAYAAFQSSLAEFQRWLNQQAAYQSAVIDYNRRYPVWAQQQAAWDQWTSDNAALLQLKALGQQYLVDRQTWVFFVTNEVFQTGVFWSGDPTVSLTTLVQFRVFMPQLLIWEAYAWFVDP